MRALILAILVGLSGSASAEIFHYIDDKGRKVYVNRESQIPHQYRERVETRAEKNGGQPAPVDPQLSAFRHELNTSLNKLDEAIDDLVTPVKVLGNQVIVPVRAVYGNRSVNTRMLLDTGASGTVFHRSALKDLNGATYSAGQARVASGEMIEVQGINLDRVEIGPFKIGTTRAMVIDPVSGASHDGLLGMDFLRQVDYRIDFDNQRILWMPDRLRELEEQRADLEKKKAMDADELRASLSDSKESAD
ncbi:retropepsin-like aspartic protease family protein [Marinobacterium lutimaris]|uniref:Aspartyl protease n=1 Tax=Marinobacterium lutimaris TaxID=568106 RepID=A0A1H5ZD79_9GAMM|nr:retropepsin-like aspartic protease [Marinobacterium lutimaris]SEG33685.1 Aspartyl protease [Marinobacterium lutimaris]